MALRAVLFDLGDTLVRLDPFPADLTGALDRCLADEGIASGNVDTADIARVVTAEIRAASAEAREAEVRIFEVIARALGGSYEAVCSRLADVWGEADVGRIRDVPGRADLLSSLKLRGLKLGIVSNTTTRPELLTAMLEDFGLRKHFDVIVYSSEAGTRKPHAAIYQVALGALSLRPEEALFAGDRLREDVLGPSRVGMKAALTHEFFQDQHGGEPVAVLQRLEDIIGLIDRLT